MEIFAGPVDRFNNQRPRPQPLAGTGGVEKGEGEEEEWQFVKGSSSSSSSLLAEDDMTDDFQTTTMRRRGRPRERIRLKYNNFPRPAGAKPTVIHCSILLGY